MSQGRIRLVSRLDIKAPNVIKGIQMEGLRVVGDPSKLARAYYMSGIDEILYVDVVASLYERSAMVDLLRDAASECFVPLTVAGGIRTTEDARVLLAAGADKVALNTAAIADPSLIRRLADEFGQQCIVLSIEAKRSSPSSWEAYTDGGREKTGLDVLTWAGQAEYSGAGEILLTSIDRDGTKRGFDVELVRRACEVSSLPVIASGGCGSVKDLNELISSTGVSAVAVGRAFHDMTLSPIDVRAELLSAGCDLRWLP